MYIMLSNPMLCILEKCIQLFQSNKMFTYKTLFHAVFTDPGSES